MRRFINGKWTSRRAWGDSRRALSSYVRVWDENDKSIGGIFPFVDDGGDRSDLVTDTFKFSSSTITVKVLNRKQNLDVYVPCFKNGKLVGEPQMLVFDGSLENDEGTLTIDKPFDTILIEVTNDDAGNVAEVQIEVYA